MGSSSSKTDDAKPVRPEPARREPVRPEPACPAPARPEPARPEPARPFSEPDGRSDTIVIKKVDIHYNINAEPMLQKTMATGCGRELRRVQAKSAWFWQEDDGKLHPFDADISDAIEEHFTENRPSVYTFSHSHNDYEVDLTRMLQTNKATKKQRRVVRILSDESLLTDTKLKSSNVGQLNRGNRPWMEFSAAPDHAQSVRREPARPFSESDGWYWQECDNSWHRYEQSTSGISSEAIEDSYRSCPRGTIEFDKGSKSYMINFQTMMQTNVDTGVERKLRRIAGKSAWFWQEDDGKWHPFDTGISSAIEEHFAKNSESKFTFSHGSNEYEIDLRNMMQTNTFTKRQRKVERRISAH